MGLDKLSEDYICERHPKSEIMQWVNSLRYFLFKRAWGGHANDGDEFQLWIRFADETDLVDKLRQLGITLNRLPDDTPKPIIGKAYSHEEYEDFKSEIPNFPHWEQPMHREIFGESVFVWVHKGNQIEINISGYYEVSAADFEKCARLEKHLDVLDWAQYADRKTDVCIISKEKYPEFYLKPISKPWWKF
jgi:hypothetical protein